MGERKARLSSKTPTSKPRKMAASGSNQDTAASIIRCPSPTLKRLRSLKEAEYIVLFTPVVPHSPGAQLDQNMDPFEPLGRAIYRHHKRIRHVPYVPSHGMTSTHVPFLTHSGAAIVVVCSTPNITSNDYAYQQKFARDILATAVQDPTLTDVPVVLLLVTNNIQNTFSDFNVFPAVVTTQSYTPAALEVVADTIFRG